MKHHWKILDKHGLHCVCVWCKCEKKIAHLKNNFHEVTYKGESETNFHRSRPNCENKINLKLNLFQNESVGSV